MIVLKNAKQLELMRTAGRISAEALKIGGEAVKAGVSTLEIDKVIHDYILSQGATPSFLGYNGFKGSACISLNDEVIHGIPSAKRVIKDGDIVSIDVGAFIGGYHGDNAYTFVCGTIPPQTQKLLDVTRQCLEKAIEAARPGARIGDISNAVQLHAETNGFYVVEEFVGHGVGQKLHEEPEVPNYGKAGRGVRLVPGMTIAIEPMINMGSAGIRQLADGWTVVTESGQPSAHFEHTIAITDNGAVILTAL